MVFFQLIPVLEGHSQNKVANIQGIHTTQWQKKKKANFKMGKVPK